MKREHVRHGLSLDEYIVTWEANEYPTDAELLKFADDGSLGGQPHHFGGVVHREDGNRRARVTVYID